MWVMERKLNITEVRDAFGDLVDEVQYKNNKLVILRHGKPAAVLVPLTVYENWKANRQRLFELIERMQDASGEQDPDEMMALVQEAQATIRGDA
jgi:prevent-host-death family protein